MLIMNNIKTKLQFLFTGLLINGLINIQPLAASTVSAEYALIIDPPSNVRVEPNGEILCQISEKTRISVFYFTTRVGGVASPMDGWYSTNACGNDNMGWIHESQIKLTGVISNQ